MMRIELVADEDTGEGAVSLPLEFEALSAIERADFLKDWLRELTEAYNEAVQDLQNPLRN